MLTGSEVNSRIAKAIREARKASGETQRAIEKKLGIGATTIHCIEDPNKSPGLLYNVVRLCIYFGISLDEVLGLEGKKHTSVPDPTDLDTY